MAKSYGPRRTRKQLTNQEPKPGGIGGPMNSFSNVGAFRPADMRVVRPNFDTLYSSGWLDLTKEPMVVSVPDTGGRYHLLPMLDMWTGRVRLAGMENDWKRSGQFPGHASRLDRRRLDGLTRIKAPTPYVWIIGRTKTDGPVDYEAVAILTLVLYSCASMRGEAGSGTYLHAL